MNLKRTFAAVAVAALAVSLLSSAPASAAPERADAAALRLFDFATNHGALGVFHDSRTSETVLRVPASGTGSALSTRDLPVSGLRATVRASRFTRAQIDTLADSLRLRDWHPAAMQYSYAFHFNPERDLTVLGTDAPAGVVAPLLSRFGGQIGYEQVPVRRQSRQSDTAPYWGGAGITDGTGRCTSGFVVQNTSGTRFMTTAGHCYAAGATVRSPGNASVLGTITTRGPLPSFDMELIGGGSYGSSIYTGDATGRGLSVAGAGDPAVGFGGYCVSGQTTAETCGKTVTSRTGTICDASGCTNGLIVYGGGTLTQGGDSGAPFYLPGAKVFILGMHIALAGTNQYAESWNSIAEHLSVTIVIS